MSTTETTPDLSIRLYGQKRPPARQQNAAAGRLSFTIEGMALRWIRLDDVELLRALAFVVRDADWGTYFPDVRADHSGSNFSLTAEITTRAARLTCRIIISASEAGLTATAEATATGDFATNRTGFVVLHPAACAGQPVRVAHTDSTTTDGMFPRLVSPHQPFFSMASIEHSPAPGVTVQTSFEGDAFEMEDQRNWSDASFKTYSRPLALPYPYTIRNGETVKQTVRIRITAQASSHRPAKRCEPTIRILDQPAGRLPLLAIGGCPQDYQAGEIALSRLAALRLPLLVAEPHLPGADPGALTAVQTAQSGTGARLALMLRRKQNQLQQLAALKPDTIALTGADAALVSEARCLFTNATIGAGTDAFFAEFNRQPPVAADFAFWTVNPTVHAEDDASIMETLAVLKDQVATARTLAPQAKLWCGPVTLRMRFNPNATGPTQISPEGIPPPDVDARQRGLFAAAFTLGQIASWAAAEVDTLVLYAPFGPRGLIHARAPYPVPWYDDQPAGAVYPVYHVLAGLAPLSQTLFRTIENIVPDKITALAANDALWLANLTPIPLTVATPGEHVRLLDQDSFVEAVHQPDGFWQRGARPMTGGRVQLNSFAVARITGAT
jgi:hypothetical protein